MKINIPKVIAKVDYGEYASEMTGQYLHVWLNPPLEVLREHDEIMRGDKSNGEGQAAKSKEEIEKDIQERENQMKEWYAKIWSQGPEGTHWTAEELRELESKDPTLLTWMINSTWQKRSEHLARKKKS